MMIALLDNGQDLDECAADLGCEVGQLLTPLTRYRLRDPEKPWAIDNGAFANLDIPALLGLLKREEHHRDRCLFVTVPDIVGCAMRTAEVFDLWAPRLAGWKIALACQDGQENVRIPWDRIDAVFIGGSNNFKCGPHAERIIRTAKLFEKWVHVGRVNHPGRYQHFAQVGADSCDGTGIARYTHMREAIGSRHDQASMEFEKCM
jgi:hypothetical protein